MSDESIFGNDDQGDAGAPKPAISIPDKAAELIGEGKKYASVEKALEALPHAQEHISTLENELKALREQVGGAVSAEEVMRTVQELLEKERGTSGSAPLDEATISGLLDRQLTEREVRKQMQANRESVDAAMKQKFGEKAKEALQTKATELGMSVKELEDLSAKTPKAALELLGIKLSAGAPVSHSKSTINTEALSQIRQEQPRPRVMTGGATTEDMVAAWRRAKPQP